MSAQFPLDLFEPLLNRGIGARDPAKLDEDTHDLEVYGNRSVTAKDAREHRYALLRTIEANVGALGWQPGEVDLAELDRIAPR